jgi:dTDP-glucose pyrophosphorylase
MIPRSNLAAAIVQPELSILETVKAIEAGGIQAVLVATGDAKLVGVATDGDIRRGILRGVTLDAPVKLVMNTQPAVLSPSASREQALVLMTKLRIRQIPVTDAAGTIIGIYHADMPGAEAEGEGHWAVIMAGGRGTRLHPLTQTTPKPMLKVGGRPLIETIVRNLIGEGFRRIYISVNYMTEVFKYHFGDGSQFGADIRYIEETTRLGTAGALGLLQERPPGPFLVMNGDLLTSVNLKSLIAYHNENHGLCTMCVRDYRVQIPYGVVETHAGQVSAIAEKPTKNFFVNAGIYVVEPSLLARIKPGEYLDMTKLIEGVIADNVRVNSFPIHEYWLDIGHADDLQRAREEFDEVFGQ